MKNLKRVLSLGLASVMLVGMMVIGAGAVDYKDFTDKDEIQHTEAVSTMNLLGVIAGKDTGAFDPSGTVTRAEMAKMITVALNGGKDPVLGTKTVPTFTDIKGHWAEKYIEYCASLNIIAGQGDGTFAPNTTVTGSQAAKMVLTALGYEASVYKLVGADWDINTNREAGNAGLYDELDALNPNEPMSRDNAAQLIWNGVQAQMLTKTPTQSVTTGEITFQYNPNGGSMLLNKFKVYTTYGQLKDVRDNKLELEIDVVYDNQNTSKTAGSPIRTFTKVKTDYSAYLGETVKVLYKASDNVVGVASVGANKTYEVPMNTVKADGAKVKFDGASYAIQNENNTTTTSTDVDDKIRVITVKADGTFTDGGIGDTTTSAIFNDPVSYDMVKFVDIDDDGVLEYAVITEVVPAKVTYASSTEIIAGTTYKKADHIIADDIKKGDYVTVTYNPFADKNEIVKVEKISGKVEGYRTASPNYEYKVDGTWYIAAASQEPVAGDELNMIAVNGVIFWSEKTGGASTLDDVVMVIKADPSTGVHQSAIILKADGSKQTVTVDPDTATANNPANKEGQLFTYSVTDNGYKFKLVSANIGDYTWKGTGKTVAGTTNVATIDSVGIADSAVIFLFDDASDKGAVITGKQLKNQALASFVDTASTAALGAFTGKVNGLTRIVMASVKVESGKTDTVAGNANNYGIVVSDSYQMDSNYITFDLWNGEEIVTVREKDTSHSWAKKNIIKYSEIDGDVIKDVASAGAVAGSVQGLNDAKTTLWVNGQVDGTNEYKIVTDTVVLYIDSSASKSAEIGVAGGEVRLADKVGTSYIQNVYVLSDTSASAKDLKLLVIDVKNNLGTKYTVQTSGTSSVSNVSISLKSGADGDGKAKGNASVTYTLTNTDSTVKRVEVNYGGAKQVVTVPAKVGATNGTLDVSFLQPAADSPSLTVATPA